MAEHKTIDFKFNVNTEGDVAYFEGYASVFGNVDAYDDVIEKGAFAKTIAKWAASGKKIPLLYQHDPASVIGVITEIKEDDYGLYVKGEINLNTEKGKEVYSLLKQGAIHGLSIGYEAKKTRNEKGVRKLLEVELWEVSLVTFPANELAEVVKVKTVVPYQDLPLAERDREWDAAAARQRVAKWASKDGSGEKDTIDWSKYKKAFLWHDSENPENFGSYKLPIADVINGRLMAVPRAIIAAAAAIQGARGGVNIPSQDKEKIKKILEKYYAKMDMVAPWQDENKSDEFDIILAKGLLEKMVNKPLTPDSLEMIKQIKSTVDAILKSFDIEIKENDAPEEKANENIETKEEAKEEEAKEETAATATEEAKEDEEQNSELDAELLEALKNKIDELLKIL